MVRDPAERRAHRVIITNLVGPRGGERAGGDGREILDVSGGVGRKLVGPKVRFGALVLRAVVKGDLVRGVQKRAPKGDGRGGVAHDSGRNNFPQGRVMMDMQ